MKKAKHSKHKKHSRKYIIMLLIVIIVICVISTVYYFINANKEKQEYNEFVSNAKKSSIYDIEATAEYGDQLLTLTTCEYSQEDGRFAVVAKKVK